MTDYKLLAEGTANADTLAGKLTEGIGFPLRQVDVGGSGSGSTAMFWRGPYQDNVSYDAGQVVTSLNWLMIANKTTSDRPDPQALGVPEWGATDSPTFATQSNTTLILSGNSYSFTESGWAETVRVWPPAIGANISYNLRLETTQFGVTTKLNVPLSGLIANQWNEIAVQRLIISAGASVRVTLEALNSSATTSWNGTWAYSGTSASNAPGDKSWNRNSGHSILRIDKTDDADADRSADLAAVTADTVIRLDQISDLSRWHEYNIQAPGTDMGDYFEFTVIQINAGANVQSGQACTVAATIPVPLGTSYVEQTNYWSGNPPSFGTVTGFLSFGGDVFQPGVFDTLFGTDLLLQKASVSDDWDFMSFTQF